MKKFFIGAMVLTLQWTLAPPLPVAAEEVAFQLRSGRLIRATVKVPPEAASVGAFDVSEGARKFPVILLFGGFQEAARVLDLIQSREPAILASFDYPFDPPRKFQFPESLRYAPALKETLQETSEGIEKLCALLRERKDVDASRMSIVGASVGSPFAVIAAERAKIPGLVIVHGFGKIRQTVQHQFVRKWEPRYGMLSQVPAWLLTTLAALYLQVPSPEESAVKLEADQKVLMISATEDSFIPKEASDGLWRALEKSQARSSRMEMEGDHLQPGSDQLIQKILSQVTAWMQASKLL